jgi:hypothetical protein
MSDFLDLKFFFEMPQNVNQSIGLGSTHNRRFVEKYHFEVALKIFLFKFSCCSRDRFFEQKLMLSSSFSCDQCKNVADMILVTLCCATLV